MHINYGIEYNKPNIDLSYLLDNSAILYSPENYSPRASLFWVWLFILFFNHTIASAISQYSVNIICSYWITYQPRTARWHSNVFFLPETMMLWINMMGILLLSTTTWGASLRYTWQLPLICFRGILYSWIKTTFPILCYNPCQKFYDGSTSAIRSRHLIRNMNYTPDS